MRAASGNSAARDATMPLNSLHARDSGSRFAQSLQCQGSGGWSVGGGWNHDKLEWLT